MNQDPTASNKPNPHRDQSAPPQKLSLSQFKIAVAAANQRFAQIRKKHPELKGYLDLSLGGSWVGINEPVATILNEFPASILDSEAKAKALEILKKLKSLKKKIEDSKTATSPDKEKLRAEEAHLTSRLEELAPCLEFDGQCQVTIGFHDLNYELIWKLQTDDLVDRNLTPQTKASIRIVLGLISDFAEMGAAECGD